MKNIILISGLIIACLFACKAPQKPAETGDSFGEKFTRKNPTDIKDVVALLEKQDTVNTQIMAKVESVCQVKGCWMNLVAPQGGDNELFVKFKDYGFFMPLDLAGKSVIVNGNAYKEVTPVDELKHYAEDEGLSQEEIDKITEPREELKFMADGVIVL